MNHSLVIIILLRHISFDTQLDESLYSITTAHLLQLWVATTGEVLDTFSSHKNQITHCTISEDGTLLITSSEDTTCNVRNSMSIIMSHVGLCIVDV